MASLASPSLSARLSPSAQRHGITSQRRTIPGGPSSSRLPLPEAASMAANHSTIPELRSVSIAGAPFELGFQLGEKTADLVNARVKVAPLLLDRMLPFIETEEGAAILERLSAPLRSKYASSWQELQGLAAGSGVPFLLILLLNFRHELRQFLPGPAPAALPATSASSEAERQSTIGGGNGRSRESEGDSAAHGLAADNCSDVAFMSRDGALIAHNEDADSSLLGNTFMVDASPAGEPRFSAYTYAGELPTICFGWNSSGMGFSADAVSPKKEEVDVDGVARTFVGRSLLGASSMEDALQRIALPNLATGHHYVLADFKHRRIVSVETGSRGRSSVRELQPNAAEPDHLFHANGYMRLAVPQIVSPSNINREKRGLEFGPITGAGSMLDLLSDTQIEDYPVYSEGKVYVPGGPVVYTLHTALFDLDQRTVSVLQGKPASRDVIAQFSVKC